VEVFDMALVSISITLDFLLDQPAETFWVEIIQTDYMKTVEIEDGPYIVQF
jgi:hypothetical protein